MLNMINRNIAFLILALFLINLCSASPVFSSPKNTPAEQQPDNNLIASFGERTITRQAIDYRVHQITQKRRQKPTDDEIAALVDQIVEQTLFAEEARALGLERDPEVQLLLQETVDKLLANLYVYRKILPQIEVSEKEIGGYYQKHKDKWKQPETVHARHILLRVNKDATAAEVQAVEAKALEIRQRLESGEDFSVLAARFSEDTGTKDKGGELGFFTRHDKIPAMAEAAFALQNGEISQPVRTSVGYHILQTLEHRPEEVKQLEDVRSDIRTHLLRVKRKEVISNERKLLEEKYKLTYRYPQVTNEEVNVEEDP